MSRLRWLARAVSSTLLLAGTSAHANSFGESGAWQFQTSADKANQALAAEVIAKRKGGYYAAPIYSTTIDRQYNCNVSASSAGNSGSNSTVANSPTTSGASSSAIGNANDTSVDGTGTSRATATPQVDSNQANTGPVRSSVVGPTQTSVTGSSTQALNSTQTNTGTQTATVGGSAGCAFGALN